MFRTKTTDASVTRSLRHFTQLTINANRPEEYLQYFENEGLNDIEYPVNPIDIPQLEQRSTSQLTSSVTLMTSVKPATQCTLVDYNSPIHIDLLYFKEHYAWIKDFSRLFADLNKYNRQAYYCKRCLGQFQSRKCIRTPPGALQPRGLHLNTSHPSRTRKHNQIHKLEIHHMGPVCYLRGP